MSRIEKQSNKILSTQKIFSSLEKSCTALFKKASKLNLDPSSEIVSSLAKTLDVDISNAREYAMGTVEILIEDANKFMKQKDLFDPTDLQSLRPSQFIWEIWRGDAYGTSEIEAMEEFLAEINDAVDTVSDSERFIKRCQTEYINMLKK